jgi:hypothetical protein
MTIAFKPSYWSLCTRYTFLVIPNAESLVFSLPNFFFVFSIQWYSSSLSLSHRHLSPIRSSKLHYDYSIESNPFGPLKRVELHFYSRWCYNMLINTLRSTNVFYVMNIHNFFLYARLILAQIKS